jgi:hypothetical protein
LSVRRSDAAFKRERLGFGDGGLIKTTVVRALMVGGDQVLRAKIWAWLRVNFGSTPYLLHVPTVTPQDVKELVEAVF